MKAGGFMSKLLLSLLVLFTADPALAAVKLYVGNLSYFASETDLQTLFANYGTVVSVQVVIDRDTGRSKGFAFVQMSTAAQAQAAIDALNGELFQDRRLTVNEARPKTGGPNRG